MRESEGTRPPVVILPAHSLSVGPHGQNHWYLRLTAWPIDVRAKNISIIHYNLDVTFDDHYILNLGGERLHLAYHI